MQRVRSTRPTSRARLRPFSRIRELAEAGDDESHSVAEAFAADD
jgi:hypothetical protein